MAILITISCALVPVRGWRVLADAGDRDAKSVAATQDCATVSEERARAFSDALTAARAELEKLRAAGLPIMVDTALHKYSGKLNKCT